MKVSLGYAELVPSFFEIPLRISISPVSAGRAS